MIILGFIKYGWAYTTADDVLDFKRDAVVDASKKLSKIISNKLPKEMRWGYGNKEHRDIGLSCMAGIESVLGVQTGMQRKFRYQFQGEFDKQTLFESGSNLIFKFKTDLGIDKTDVSLESSTVAYAMFVLPDIFDKDFFERTPLGSAVPTMAHQVYMLSAVQYLSVLGTKMFLTLASDLEASKDADPDRSSRIVYRLGFQDRFRESVLISKMMSKFSKLNVSPKGAKTKFKGVENVSLVNMTTNLKDAYIQLVTKYPNLSISGVDENDNSAKLNFAKKMVKQLSVLYGKNVSV